MANVGLKKDFLDGDKLFASQLNNNFGAIEAALGAMNKIVWQDDDNESLMYFKGTTEEVAARDIIEGQLLYDMTLGLHYIDHDNTRVEVLTGSAIDLLVNSLSGNETNRAPSVKAVNDVFKYSTTEIKTNATGTDNKPIYRKTINVSDLTPDNNNRKTIAHGISNFGRLTKIECAAVNNEDLNYDFNNYTWKDEVTGKINTAHVHVDSTNVYIDYIEDSYITWVSDANITIEYTKTTD